MNHKNAVNACKRSKIAYMDPKRIKTIFKQSKFYDGAKTTKHDAQAFLYKADNKVYVTYRGTMDLMDTRDILDIRHQKFMHSIVHKGFYSQFFSIEEQITQDIKDISESYLVNELVFSGHSLGGSCALIASPFYKHLFKDRFRISTFTFGTVTVGNSDFVKMFDMHVDDYLRIENKNDIIPMIPVHNSFHHVTKGIVIDDQGCITKTSATKPRDYQKILKYILEKKDWDEIVKDHSCDVYKKNLLLSAKKSAAFWDDIL